MRANIATSTNPAVNRTRRIAKRAALFALLASATAVATAQFPTGGLIDSSQTQDRHQARIVHHAKTPRMAKTAGVIRSNPFVTDTKNTAVTDEMIQLVSGPGAAVRLKESKNKVGFAPIGGQIAPTAAPASQPNAMPTISAPHQVIPQPVNSPQIVGVPADQTIPTAQVHAPVPVKPVDAMPMINRQSRQAIAEASARAVDQLEPTIEYGVVGAAPELVSNAFEKHRRKGEVQSPRADAESTVIPVVDARDDQKAIQETQPIFFTLSDEPTQPVVESTEETASPAEAAPEPTVQDEVVPGASEPCTDPEACVAEAEVAQAEPVEEEVAHEGLTRAPVHLAQPEANAAQPAELSLSDLDDVPNESSSPLAAVETPVHLSPVVTLAEEIPTPAEENGPVVRYNPNIDSEGSDSELADETPIQIVRPVPRIARKPIAVATPPIVIAHADQSGQGMKPAVDAVVHDPTAPPVAKLPSLDLTSQPELAKAARDRAEFEKEMIVDRRPTIHVAKALPRLAADATPLPEPITEASEPQLPKPEPEKAPAAEAIANAETPSTLPLPQPPSENEVAVLADASDTQGPKAALASSQLNDSEPRHALSSYRKAAEPDLPRKPVVLNLTRAQVRSMTIGGRLRRVSIANKDVCQAFASGANQLKLIGTGLGKTQLTIWADVAPGEPTRMQTFEVDVSNSVDATGDKYSEHTALLNDSISKAFPNANVIVSRQSGKLVVTGNCSDEDSAKKIVRMVRKSCLVPVEDNVKVR